MANPLDLESFKLSQATLEVRYDNAYILWDRAGEIWSRINNMWNGIKPSKVEPSSIIFSLDNKYQLSVELDKAYIIDSKPSSSLKDFIERADTFMKLIIQPLKIKEFTRIGFRPVYVKSFPDKTLAAKAMLATEMILVPKGKHFNIEGRMLLPKYAVVLEADSVAVRIALEARDRKIDFDAHPGIEELQSLHLEKHELVYDVDYYTLAKVSVGQLDMKEWISQSYRLIRRDSNSFLGGD
jgi:hypothetical protein